LTPTRELAGQVLEATQTFGRFMRFTSASLLGGMSYNIQFQALGKPLDLVVATPGRLIDHLNRGSIDLSRVEILVLDEADRMLDMGFKEDVEKITAATPANRQTLLFTATMDKAMTALATGLLNNPVRIAVAQDKETLENIEHRLHVTDNLQHKQRLLQHLVADQQVQQAIIFSATKRDADTLARELTAQGHRTAALHGDMNQGARNRTIRDLRRGRIRCWWLRMSRLAVLTSPASAMSSTSTCPNSPKTMSTGLAVPAVPVPRASPSPLCPDRIWGR
jgi:superfamily II DNA/RNA helicase